MKHGFQNEFLDVRTRDGLNDLLLCPLIYLAKDGELYRAPKGGSTDGLSVPKIVQNIPGFSACGEGDWWSGVGHDSPYRGQLQRFDKDTEDWVAANLTRLQADDLIKEMLESQLLLEPVAVKDGATTWERVKVVTANTKIALVNAKTRTQIQIIYRALRLAGQKAWDENRSLAGIIRNQIVNF
jgi:hypothetical protein